MSGEYPADWSMPELGDFAKATGGSRFPPAAQGSKEGDYPFYKVSDMNLPGNERFMGVANHWITEATRKKIKAKTFPAGSMIFPKIGAAVATNKKRLLTQESIIDNNVMAVVVEDPNVCAFEYLRFWFETIDLQNLSNSGALPSIPGHRVHSMHVPLPPLPEQKKIAHILSTVQRAIEAQERIIQTTTELKKALMHKLFTEGLRNEPQKQTEIGTVPRSWEVVKLSDVCRFQSGGTPSKKNPEFWQGAIPWVSPKDMKRPRLNDVADHISQEALESGSKLAPAGSVFVVVRGMILAKTVPVALAEVPMAINQDMKAIVPGSKLRSDFLLYALETLRGNLFKKVGRSGHGTATLMGHEVAAFKIPLPDLATQAEIASAIQNLERKKELHEQKQTQFQDLFRTLLHALMTAKTRVHELNFQG